MQPLFPWFSAPPASTTVRTGRQPSTSKVLAKGEFRERVNVRVEVFDSTTVAECELLLPGDSRRRLRYVLTNYPRGAIPVHGGTGIIPGKWRAQICPADNNRGDAVSGIGRRTPARIGRVEPAKNLIAAAGGLEYSRSSFSGFLACARVRLRARVLTALAAVLA